MVKVLVVDDSAFMRNALSKMLSSDPEITVIGTARDGLEAIAKVKTLKPDIVTMDVEMPRMDGLEALRHIMAEAPLPVVMVSSLTSDGAQVTLDALESGALDFIPKNLQDLSVNILKIKQILNDKIKHLARVRVRPAIRRPVTPPPPRQMEAAEREIAKRESLITGERRIGLLAIGTSTGGPKALQEILSKFPANFPVPIVIAQHMPRNFTGPFAERLNQLSAIEVREAKDGDRLANGLALLAPGGKNMRLRRVGAIETIVTLTDNHDEFIYCPSVDALLLSAAEVYPGRTLGLILTGMGNDGMKGMVAIKAGGGRAFAQDEPSCVVYGMPKAVVDKGLADKVLPLEKIAGEIINSL